MELNDELTIELAKNKADEIIAKKELEIAKNKFITALNNGIGEEIKCHNISEFNKPIKYSKPFKLKLKEFFSKLNKIL